MKNLPLPLLLLLFFLTSPAFARGMGTNSYFISLEGTLITSLGDTYPLELDADAGILFRHKEGVITASPFSDPHKILWSTPVELDVSYTYKSRPTWWQIPNDRLILLEKSHILCLNKSTGKPIYRIPRTANASFTFPEKSTMYLIDDLAQRKSSGPGKSDSDFDRPSLPPANASALSRLDLQSGKTLWTTTPRTPENHYLLIGKITADGTITTRDHKTLYIDPATGKILKENPTPPATQPTPQIVAASQAADRLTKILGEKYKSLAPHALFTDNLLLLPLPIDPAHTDQTPLRAEVLALSPATGKELWRFQVPNVRFTDVMSLTVHPCKNGFLIHHHWLIYD